MSKLSWLGLWPIAACSRSSESRKAIDQSSLTVSLRKGWGELKKFRDRYPSSQELHVPV